MIQPNSHYELYEGCGPESGQHEHDWLQAEQDEQGWLRAEQDQQDFLRAEQETIFTQQR